MKKGSGGIKIKAWVRKENGYIWKGPLTLREGDGQHKLTLGSGVRAVVHIEELRPVIIPPKAWRIVREMREHARDGEGDYGLNIRDNTISCDFEEVVLDWERYTMEERVAFIGWLTGLRGKTTGKISIIFPAQERKVKHGKA